MNARAISNTISVGRALGYSDERWCDELRHVNPTLCRNRRRYTHIKHTERTSKFVPFEQLTPINVAKIASDSVEACQSLVFDDSGHIPVDTS